jgi:hypothetical protein
LSSTSRASKSNAAASSPFSPSPRVVEVPVCTSESDVDVRSVVNPVVIFAVLPSTDSSSCLSPIEVTEPVDVGVPSPVVDEPAGVPVAAPPVSV